MVEIKVRLQEAITARNITRSELSDLSGVPRPMITDYLKGRYKPKQDKIYALSRALRVNPAWFMGYEDADMDDLSYLEPPPPDNEQLVLSLFRQLNENEQQDVIRYAEFTLHKKINTDTVGDIA